MNCIDKISEIQQSGDECAGELAKAAGEYVQTLVNLYRQGVELPEDVVERIKQLEKGDPNEPEAGEAAAPERAY